MSIRLNSMSIHFNSISIYFYLLFSEKTSSYSLILFSHS